MIKSLAMRLRLFLIQLLIIITACTGLAASEDILFTLDQDAIVLAPGRVEKLYITAQVPKDFHAYSDKLKVKSVRPEGFTVGQVEIKNEIKFFDKFTKKSRMGFSNKNTIMFQFETPIDINETIKKISFDIYYQICSEKVCFLPRMQTLTVQVKVDKNSTKPIAKVAESKSEISLINQLEQALSKNIFYAFLISFFAGVLTSFTPCIFPMIPITISILGHHAEKNTRVQNFFRSLLYVHGIALTYSILGVLAALTGNLFGNALSNKYILISMVILFFTMALSMWGLFDLQVPVFIRNRLGIGSKHGYHGVFLMGIISGVVASPCVGPVLVSILSYVSTTKDVALGFGLLFTYAMGLGLIFIVIGIFGQALSLLPRSGAWMNKVKYVLGFIMVLTGLYYLRLAFPAATHENKTAWENYTIEKFELARSNNKPVIIDFQAEWCAACHELDEKTFSQPEFESMAKDFMLLKVDATEDTPEIQVILKKYDVKGLPTVLFVNRNGKILNHLTFTQFLEWKEFKLKMIEALKN